MNNETNIENQTNKEPNNKLRRLIALGILGLTLYSGAKIVEKGYDYLTSPSANFSQETAEYIIGPGEGLFNAAGHIEGVGSIPLDQAATYIEEMPANKDALSDGLQPNERIEIPVSVTKR